MTKNGYGSMVVMSVEQFEHISGGVEFALDSADRQAATTSLRYAHDEVLGSTREGSAMSEKPQRYRLRYLPLLRRSQESVSCTADVLKGRKPPSA